jgi:ribonuclease HIII
MSQQTLVIQLDRAAQAQLQDRMNGASFEYRPLPHTRFSARGEGVVATLYSSGKLVVQGREAEVFVARFLDGLGQRKQRAAKPPSASEDVPGLGKSPLIGSDEAGKGDYFGPLVTVACRAEPDEREELIQAGVADSKTLSDGRVLRLSAALRTRYRFAIEVLDPPAYNQEYGLTPNLNTILVGMHGRAIRSLAHDGDMALVDRFASEELLVKELKDLKLDLFQFPRAEREPVVAAASIIARAVFLEKLGELSDEFAIVLRKGAGVPTDASGRKFLSLHGPDKLRQVAKLHFKNTKKIGG